MSSNPVNIHKVSGCRLGKRLKQNKTVHFFFTAAFKEFKLLWSLNYSPETIPGPQCVNPHGCSLVTGVSLSLFYFTWAQRKSATSLRFAPSGVQLIWIH